MEEVEQEVQQGIIIEEIDEYGILQETVLIYLGDGIYAEKPKEFSRNKRESSDTDNNICGGSEENSKGSKNWNYNTRSIY